MIAINFLTVTIGPVGFMAASLACLAVAYRLLVWICGGER